MIIVNCVYEIEPEGADGKAKFEITTNKIKYNFTVTQFSHIFSKFLDSTVIPEAIQIASTLT